MQLREELKVEQAVYVIRDSMMMEQICFAKLALLLVPLALHHPQTVILVIQLQNIEQ